MALSCYTADRPWNSIPAVQGCGRRWLRVLMIRFFSWHVSRKKDPKIVNNPSEPDLIKVTEIFLVPNSFLVAALGTADSNPHRAMVSMLGLSISMLWWICSHDALRDRSVDVSQTRRIRILSWLAPIFIFGWLLSTIIHVSLWTRPLGA